MKLSSMRRSAVGAFLAGAMALGTTGAKAEEIKLRIASGHAPATPYVNLMSTFFAPEVSKRVAARTKHKVEWIEGYGGSMIKVADTLEGVQTGIIDVGGYCFCFEPSNLPMHAFQVMLPFGTMSAVKSGKIARGVYEKVPYLAETFEKKYSQKLLGLIADNGYSLNTTFEWNKLADLKGKKIAGAGLNLKWLEYAGVTGVQSSAVEGYTSMKTGVYQGFVIFPSITVTLKWYEVAKHYTLIGFGAITWHGLTVNTGRWKRLPKEVQDIMAEVAREFEVKTGTVNEENYPKQLAFIKSQGGTVKSVPVDVTREWANSLKNWPQEKATELDAKGIPASVVLKTTLEEAERQGHVWPIHYEIKQGVANKK